MNLRDLAFGDCCCNDGLGSSPTLPPGWAPSSSTSSRGAVTRVANVPLYPSPAVPAGLDYVLIADAGTKLLVDASAPGGWSRVRVVGPARFVAGELGQGNRQVAAPAPPGPLWTQDRYLAAPPSTSGAWWLLLIAAAALSR